MAAKTGVTGVHATLTTTTADSVTLSYGGSSLCVTNRDSSVTLYFTVNTSTAVTAVSAANDTYVVLPLQSKVLALHGIGNTVVSVVGNGNAYSVEVY